MCMGAETDHVVSLPPRIRDRMVEDLRRNTTHVRLEIEWEIGRAIPGYMSRDLVCRQA